MAIVACWVFIVLSTFSNRWHCLVFSDQPFVDLYVVSASSCFHMKLVIYYTTFNPISFTIKPLLIFLLLLFYHFFYSFSVISMQKYNYFFPFHQQPQVTHKQVLANNQTGIHTLFCLLLVVNISQSPQVYWASLLPLPSL